MAHQAKNIILQDKVSKYTRHHLYNGHNEVSPKIMYC